MVKNLTLVVQGSTGSRHKACREKHARRNDLNSHQGISMRLNAETIHCSNYKHVIIIYITTSMITLIMTVISLIITITTTVIGEYH